VALTPELIDARAREMWERMLHSLGHRGISREAYLQILGREEADILAEMLPEAELALRREAVLTAVVAAEGIEPSEEQLLAALAPTAEREGIEPGKLLEQLRGAGRLEEAREDLAAREAIDLIADHVGAGAGARAAVDARQGGAGVERERRRRGAGRGAREVVDPHGLTIGQLAFSRGIRSARRNKGEDMSEKRAL
jgi:FKBP-type peptidyl-prolyl cis-trans isomerase (trigger factor)